MFMIGDSVQHTELERVRGGEVERL